MVLGLDEDGWGMRMLGRDGETWGGMGTLGENKDGDTGEG